MDNLEDHPKYVEFTKIAKAAEGMNDYLVDLSVKFALTHNLDDTGIYYLALLVNLAELNGRRLDAKEAVSRFEKVAELGGV